MGIRIFFILSFLFFFLGILFVYKVPERVSLFRSMVICYITELCFGAVVVGVYSLIGIPIGLTSLGIAYCVMGVLAWAVIICQKKVQKVKIINWDVYSAIIIALWFLAVFLKVFSPSILDAYINSDPVRHFQYALRVMNTGKASAMYFAEVYNAMVMELLSPFLSKYSLFKAFILADSFANLINVFVFYCLVATFIKSKFSKIILPFLSFLYFAGWPFFSYVVGGFVYFGWGVTLFAYVVYLLIKLYDSEDRRNRLILLGLVLIGTFSVLAAYLLFAVILAGIVFLSLIFTNNKIGAINLKKNILKICVVVLPLAIGIFSFCFWGYFKGDFSFVLIFLGNDGWIAKELYQDFVYLMPGVFYMGWKYIKNKEVNIIFISVSVILAYICCTFIMCLCGIMSPYYYYKSYYLLWLFAWIINVAFIEYLYQKERVMLFSCGGTLLIVILISMTGFDSKLAGRGIVHEDIAHRTYPSQVPIWDYMEGFFRHDHNLSDKYAVFELIEYVNDTFGEKESIPIISNEYYALWYETYTTNEYIRVTSDEEFAKAIQECRDNGYRYIIIYQNTEIYRLNKEVLSDFENVYDNGYYGVYMLY